MPRLVDQPTLRSSLALATRNVLATEGVAGLSLRAVAREARVSPSCLLHHYGTARRALEVAARIFARDRLEEMRRRCAARGLSGCLPDQPEELIDVRAWQGWLELGRSDEDVARIVAAARRWQRALVGDALDYRIDGPELDGLVAVIDGLQAALSVPEAPVPLPRAHEILARASRAQLALAPPARQPDESARWLVRTSPIQL